jgi:hypothetical protein
MSATSMTQLSTEVSPKATARAAGFFWLITFVSGSFSMATYMKIVTSDPAVTAANVLAQQSLFRLSIAMDLLASLTYMAAVLLMYELLKPVSRKVSLMAAGFGFAGCVLSGVSFFFRLAPLSVLGNTRNATAFTAEQAQAMAFTLLKIGEHGSMINFVFFGLHCLLVGYLIVRSTFLPRIVGALMIFAGIGWLTQSLANLLAPEFGRSLQPMIMAPGAIGEATLTLWLLIVGVNVARWKASAVAAADRASPAVPQPA